MPLRRNGREEDHERGDDQDGHEEHCPTTPSVRTPRLTAAARGRIRRRTPTASRLIRGEASRAIMRP